jgi:hypothetical protein
VLIGQRILWDVRSAPLSSAGWSEGDVGDVLARQRYQEQGTSPLEGLRIRTQTVIMRRRRRPAGATASRVRGWIRARESLADSVLRSLLNGSTCLRGSSPRVEGVSPQ